MSALRINLLPAYLAEVRNTKRAIVGFSALFILALAASGGYYYVTQTETVKQEEAANQMEQDATTKTSEVTKIKGEASTLRAKIAPIQDKVAFVEDVRFYNTWVQKIYRRAARYTDRRVEYSSMAVNGGTLSMTGYAQSVDDLARYLITFYGNPDVTAVSVTGPPAWQRPSQTVVNPLEAQTPSTTTGFNFTVTATLLKSLQRPIPPASLDGDPSGGAGATGASATGRPTVSGAPIPRGPASGAPAGGAAMGGAEASGPAARD